MCYLETDIWGLTNNSFLMFIHNDDNVVKWKIACISAIYHFEGLSVSFALRKKLTAETIF